MTYSAALSTSDAGVNELVVIFHGTYAETVRKSETTNGSALSKGTSGKSGNLGLANFLGFRYDFLSVAKCIYFIGICCFKGVNFSIAVLSDKSLALGLHLIH